MNAEPGARKGDDTRETPGDWVIRARGVECHFGAGGKRVHALGPVDLDVSEGEFVALVGPSGCGKSTLVRIIAGLLPPTTGTVDVRFGGNRATTIATVFQDYGIFPWKTVSENIMFALRVQGVPKRSAQQITHDWLERLGLGAFAKAYPATLSGGMRQRVAIARALAVEPELLLMDEPFAALDAQTRELLQEELLALCQTRNLTVVFITHSLDEAVLLSDRVVVMTHRPGRILDERTVPFARPRDPSVRQDPEFGALRVALWDHLRDEVAGPAEQENVA